MYAEYKYVAKYLILFENYYNSVLLDYIIILSVVFGLVPSILYNMPFSQTAITTP